MAQDINAANSASLARMRQVADSLTDEELARPLGDGWTAGAVFGHLAFWDARAVELIGRWQGGNHAPAASDADPINNALLPQWLLLPPRAAAELAIAQAELVDAKLAALSADELAELAKEAEQLDMTIDRAEHRDEHMDELKARLGKR